MQVALLIDYDNLMGLNLKTDVDLNRNYSHPDVVAYLEMHYGPVVFCKAYADWSFVRTRHTAIDLAKAGSEMQFIPRATTNNYRIPAYAAGCMGLDALDALARNPEIGAVVFGTNDLGLIPFVTRIKSMGKKVYILGAEAASAASLTRVSDEFISIGNGSAPAAPAAPVADEVANEMTVAPAAAPAAAQTTAIRTRPNNAPDRSQAIYAIKTALAGGELPIADLEEKVTAAMPEFSVKDFACDSFEAFLRNIANTSVKIVRKDDGALFVALGNCHNASAYSDEELQSFDLAQYMQATRWHITDGDIRDKVLHNIYIIFSEKTSVDEEGNPVFPEMSNEDLRNTVDPQHVVEDKPWQGTIWTLIFGGCLWENPRTQTQPQSRRVLSLFKGVESEDDFLVRYYTSLFKKAFEDRPGLTPQMCAELMHPENVEGALPLFQRVFECLKAPVVPRKPVATRRAPRR